MPPADDATLVQKVENVFVVKGNIKLPQQHHVFILERFSLVMFFLVLNVANYRAQL